MKKIISLLLSLFLIGTVGAQTQNSLNGHSFPSKGNARLFLIFAEVQNDPYDMTIPAWNKGQMPNSVYIQQTVNAIEQYFKEASFGMLNIEVDYCPKLIQVEYKSSGNIFYSTEAFGKLQELYGDTGFITPKGLKFPEEFDAWTMNTENTVKDLKPDGMIDYLAVFFRINSRLVKEPTITYGGKTSTWDVDGKLFTAEGTNNASFMVVPPNSMGFLLRHEFGHSLLGENKFHSGMQGAGISTYIHGFSGYGLLSSTNCSNHFCNAWDRRRLGWKRADKKYFIGAMTESGSQEVTADLVYDKSDYSTKLFRLRDFTTYGDAVRIKLPYMDSKTRPQWIWIENHQPKPGTIEYKSYYYDELNKPVPKGMYVNYQVGNESFTDFDSRTNYYTPEISLGNYDLTKIVANGSAFDCYVDDSLSNPFTGYDFISNPGYDRNGNGVLSSGEQISAARLFVNGKAIPNTDCHYAQYLLMGSKYNAFTEGQKLCVSTNPAPVPRLTYRNVGTFPDDNRKIYLNGLSIEMRKQYDNGDILVAVSFTDRRVRNDVRWCGDIVLNELLAVVSQSTLLLDQGLSATRLGSSILFRGKRVFADPTFFTCNSGSRISLSEGSKLVVRNNSTLLINEGATLSAGKGRVVVESGGTLKICKGGSLRTYGGGEIRIRKGGYICVEDSAKIDLPTDAYLVVEDPACYGVNPAIPALQGSQFATSAEDIKYLGSGKIVGYSEMLYLQSKTLSEKKKYFAKNVQIGGLEENLKYKVSGTGNLIIEADGEIVIPNGFEVEQGGEIEFQKGI